MVNKTRFFRSCPKTRAGFVSLFNSDYKFRNSAKVLGFNVIGDTVIFPSGKVANAHIK